jgi:diguanylate cyclase (GGDEF)-like protein
MSIDRRARTTTRATSKRALLELALTDALTGLANRRAFDETLAVEWRRAARAGATLGLLMIDIDYFKRFNDTYGHVAGDACLSTIARAIAACVKRPGDLGARYGGEEFAIVLCDTDAAGAMDVAKAVCDAVRALELPNRASSLGYVTVSAGAAALSPVAGGDPQQIVAAADERLYAAKSGGRNRAAGYGLVAEAPAAYPYEAPRDNLPRDLTSFIGREKQLSEIRTLLEEHALLTIVGSGGVGKTRVALEAARTLGDRYADGVWLVELGALTDGALVATAIAQTLGIALPATGDPLAALGSALHAKRLLLILDTCEHVIEAAAESASAIARHAPGVAILATSRQPLRAHGEVTYRLPSLALPGSGDAATISLDRALGFESVKLFVRRSQDVNPAFSVDDDDVPVIVDICRRLDGIALAIELAAARTPVLSALQLRAMLDERFAILTAGSRDALPRQQTLRALIDWSHDLLDDRERRLFRRLEVFPADFTLDAVTQVCADDGMDAGAILDALGALVDRSLVIANVSAEPRYRFLESTRAYAREKLIASGEFDPFHDRHLAYVRSRFDAAGAEYEATKAASTVGRLAGLLEDARAAIEWALHRGEGTAAADLFLVTQLWEHLGLYRESIAITERLAAALPGDDRQRAARLAQRLTSLLIKTGNYDAACVAAEHAVEYARACGAAQVLANSLCRYGEVLTALRRLDEAEAALDGAEHAAPLTWRREGNILTARAGIAYGRNDFVRAAALYERTRDLYRRVGYERGEIIALENLAEVDHARGETSRAIAGARDVLTRVGELPFNRAMCLHNLAGYLAASGDADGAATAAREVLDFFAQHDPGDTWAALTVEHLALALALNGDTHRAARFGAYADAQIQRHGFERGLTEWRTYHRLQEILAASPFPDDIRIAREQGVSLTPEAILAEARES